MGTLLQIINASKSYGDQVLLDEAEATITDDVKIGFIGRNGAGKSTLLRIILGEEELDSGEIVRHSGLRLGYLHQHDPFQPGETALEFLMRDSGQPDWKCGEVAGQFELKGAALEGPIAQLSGGWQTRVKLAALLLPEPNLLLLDEPTNFLDLHTQILLEHFLKNHRSACLVVSHDRAFLNATCDTTLELKRGKLTSFPGRVDAFLEYQREQREIDIRSNETIRAKQRELEDYIARNKARASTASLARSKAKQLERLELTEVDVDERTARIRAPHVDPRQGPALRCRELTIGYPEKQIASDIRVEIDHGSRAGVVGDNGQGKTTFLRTIVDSLPPIAGEIQWGHGCTIGVYAQHVYTSLPQEQTVLEYLERQAAPGRKDQDILDIAGAFLFSKVHVSKPIAILSGGERARLCLAALLLGDYNVLILDEPANHLDVETVDSLAEALIDYQGTVIFTSHDRHFTRRISTCIVEVRNGRVTNYSGNYENYVYRVNKQIEAGEREQAAKKQKNEQATSAKPARSTARVTQADLRRWRKQIEKLERTMAQFEEQKAALTAEFKGTVDPDEALRLHGELEAVAAQLGEAEDQWCVVQEKVEGVEV